MVMPNVFIFADFRRNLVFRRLPMEVLVADFWDTRKTGFVRGLVNVFLVQKRVHGGPGTDVGLAGALNHAPL